MVTLPMAVAIATVFAVHPSHAEPVMWIASRTDLVATLFGLWGLLLFVRGRVGWSAAAFFVGLLAKESVVVLPLILAAYVYFFRPSSSWRQAGWFGAAFAAYLALRLVLIGPALDNGLARSGGIKLVGTTLIQIVRTFLPGLPMGDSTLNNSEAITTFAGIVTLLAGLLVIAVAFRRSVDFGPHSDPELQPIPEEANLRSFLLAAFVISSLPAAGLAVRLFRAQGERFLYLPSVFLLAWLLLRLFGTNYRRVAWVTVGGFLLLQFQSIFWQRGAEVAHRVDIAVARDVVPRLSPETPRIALLNAPVRVQGSYAAFYVLGEIARNHGANAALEVEVLTALQLYEGSHSVTREGLTLSIRPGDGVFLPEETFGTQSPSPEELRQRGLTGLSRTQASFAPPEPRTPTFWWDGRRFIPLGQW